jgi:hypothetical protein
LLSVLHPFLGAETLGDRYCPTEELHQREQRNILVMYIPEDSRLRTSHAPSLSKPMDSLIKQYHFFSNDCCVQTDFIRLAREQLKSIMKSICTCKFKLKEAIFLGIQGICELPQDLKKSFMQQATIKDSSQSHRSHNNTTDASPKSKTKTTVITAGPSSVMVTWPEISTNDRFGLEQQRWWQQYVKNCNSHNFPLCVEQWPAKVK